MSENLNQALSLLNKAHKYSPKRFNLESYCFDKQLLFIRDESKFKMAVCSRRAGKTVAVAAYLIHAALNKPKINCLYIALSRISAKQIIWPELLDINRVFQLDAKINETELSLKFPNGSKVFLSGASDSKEIDKLRGRSFYLCCIDECQSFRPYIENLIDEVISKGLFDYNGTLCLTGTPGPVMAGYFYECDQGKKKQGWSHHFWTMHENPWLPKKSGKTIEELIQQDCTRMGVGLNHPTIQRESFGLWCTDTNALVFQYDATRNHFTSVPPTEHPWSYIIGVDLGYDDSDAIAVLSYNPKCKAAYLVEEVVKEKQGITELVEQITRLAEKYKPDIIVMDTGGLGKKIAEEITRRYAIMIEPAEKVRKFEFIEILNDALRTEKFFARKDSNFAQDCALLEWDRDAEVQSEKPKICDSHHSDICDAVLYAFRECYHWLFEPDIAKPKPNTEAWFKAQEEEIEKDAIERMERKSVIDLWDKPLDGWS